MMPCYAALDVSQETTAIYIVDEAGRILAEKKVATCPDAIAAYLNRKAPNLVCVGLETGPLSVRLWNELAARRLPILCIDARHANAALKMRPVKTGRNDAAGLAQIMRPGWFKEVNIKSRSSYQVRSLLIAREMLVRIRVKIENEIRGLLRTLGVLFGKRAGGFTGRADEIIAGELDPSPQKHLYEAATMLLTRNLRFSMLKAWRLKLARTSGFKKARIAVARKMAVILHAKWKASTPFRWSQAAA